MHKVIWNKQDSYMKKMKLKNLQTNLKTIMNYKEFKINLELSYKDTTSDYKVMKQYTKYLKKYDQNFR
jgi:hypothetical protein